MQVNSLFQGMFGIGVPGGMPGAAPGALPEEGSQAFEDMLVEQSKQNQAEKQPAAKKEEAAEKKPQQPEKAEGKQEPAGEEEGMEVAAGLVTSQPVVLFDVVNVQQAPEAVMQAAAPVEVLAEQAPVVQEAAAPLMQEQPAQPEAQLEAEAPAPEATGFQEEAQQVPTVEAQPEAQQAEVEAKPQEQPKLQVESGETPVADQEADAEVEEVWYEGERPVFRRETEAPVKVGENYEPVAPEKPEAPSQLANHVMQMLNAGDSRVEIALNPANLGHMTISITRMQDGALHVVLGAVSEKATSLLRENSAQLHTLLAAANHGEVHVEVQQAEPQQQQQNPFMNPDDQGRQQPQQQHKPQQQAESEDFVQQLRLGLVEKEEE